MEAFSFWKGSLIFPRHPREDAVIVNDKWGIFVVADGVTLAHGIEYVGKYPRISPACAIANVFASVFLISVLGERSVKNPVRKAFREANKAAGRINKNRSKFTVLSKCNNLFAATASMAVIRGNMLHWGQLCDAGIGVINKNGILKFRKDTYVNLFPVQRDIELYDTRSRLLFFRTIMRNAVSLEGRPQGYGVVTGEPDAELFLQSASYPLEEGDTVILYSDGFSSYLQSPSFLRLLANTPLEKLRAKIEEVIDKKTARIREGLRNQAIDYEASVENIIERVKEILGDRYVDRKYDEEKSIIVVRPW
jgi:serine/threonine protein phosphatase PrpC